MQLELCFAVCCNPGLGTPLWLHLHFRLVFAGLQVWLSVRTVRVQLFYRAAGVIFC
jgi:hypothetical protein